MEKKIIPARSCKSVINMELFFISGNRDINLKHVNKIKKAMLEGVNFPPLEVDAVENIIIDGQHRYAAAKQLWEEGIEYPLLCHFYNSDNPLLDAIHFNNTQLHWKLEDYINAYIADENENYIKFKHWVQDKSLLNNTGKFAAAAVMFGYSHNDIKEGRFIFPEDTTIPDQVYEEIASFRSLNLFHKTCVKAWMNIRNYCLLEMNFNSYYELWKRYFLFPGTMTIPELENAFKDVINR